MTSGPIWNPELYATHAHFVPELGMAALELLAPQRGERILDLGCGDGVLTIKLKERGCAVVGVDASREMVDAARALGLDARVLDGQALGFDQEFDAVFSNAALHWMRRPDEVIIGVWRALKPGGRFVAECGGYGNVAAIQSALAVALAKRGIDARQVNPWYFPSAEEYGARLERQGFIVESIELILRPTPLLGGILSWLKIFAQDFTAALTISEHEAFLIEVRDSLRARLCDQHGSWTVDYVRLRFCARKPYTPKQVNQNDNDNLPIATSAGA
jgi:trans-aconitate methyltransferase